MFGFLKKDPPGPKVIDKVWLSANAKKRACKLMAEVDPACIFVAWFEGTRIEMENALSGTGARVLLSKELTKADIAGRMLVFVEHHPSAKKEAALFNSLQVNEVPVLSSLDEPLLMYFGGEKVIELVKRLGMKEDEAIGNSMVVRSIRRAQEKIDSKIEVERPAATAAEWFRNNLPPGTS